MSRSFRDRPTWKTAELRMKTDRENKVVYPVVIQRGCAKSEYYPFDKRPIVKLMKMFPKEYIYGLKRVELRPCKGKIGKPYGVYLISSKSIILYSVPKGVWEFDSLSSGWQGHFENYDAKIIKGEGRAVAVKWGAFGLAYFYYTLFLHELGHHYQYQYPTKKKKIHNKLSEQNANMTMDRLTEKGFFKVWFCSKNAKM